MDKDVIKAVAKSHGLTLKAIAAKMGVSAQAMQEYFKGNMTVGTLERIAAAIGCSVADFYATADTPSSCRCPRCGAALNISLTPADN